MNKSLEVRIAYGPSCGWEAALVVVNGYGAVQRPVSGFANPAVYQQYLLVYLLSSVIRSWTDELSRWGILRM